MISAAGPPAASSSTRRAPSTSTFHHRHGDCAPPCHIFTATRRASRRPQASCVPTFITVVSSFWSSRVTPTSSTSEQRLQLHEDASGRPPPLVGNASRALQLPRTFPKARCRQKVLHNCASVDPRRTQPLACLDRQMWQGRAYSSPWCRCGSVSDLDRFSDFDRRKHTHSSINRRARAQISGSVTSHREPAPMPAFATTQVGAHESARCSGVARDKLHDQPGGNRVQHAKAVPVGRTVVCIP